MDGHIHDAAHAEAEQAALLAPGVDAPAGGRRGVGLGGADVSVVELGLERPKKPEVVVAIVGGHAVVERFDFRLQFESSPTGVTFPVDLTHRAPFRFWRGWSRWAVRAANGKQVRAGPSGPLPL